MLKRLAAVAATAALIVGVPAAAHADPKNALTLTLNCDNGETYDINVFSNGTYSAGLLVAGNGVVRPVALDITGTFTPAVGEPETFTEIDSKNVGSKTQTTDCDVSQTFTFDDGTLVVEGSVTIVVP